MTGSRETAGPTSVKEELMAQTAAAQQGAGTPAAPAPAAPPTGAQAAPGGPVLVEKQPFSTFSFTLTILLVLMLFCYYYFRVRRKEHTRHVDAKAGDEGED